MPATHPALVRPHLSDRPRSASWKAAVATTLLPIAAAVGTVVVMGSAAAPTESVGDVGITVVFVAWNLLPMVGAALLLLWAGRHGWLSYAAAALGAVGVAVVTALSLHDFWTSASSTSALVFIFLPFVQWTAVGVAVALVAVTRLRTHRRQTPRR